MVLVLDKVAVNSGVTAKQFVCKSNRLACVKLSRRDHVSTLSVRRACRLFVYRLALITRAQLKDILSYFSRVQNYL